jgi:hypothetical protein
LYTTVDLKEKEKNIFIPALLNKGKQEDKPGLVAVRVCSGIRKPCRLVA